MRLIEAICRSKYLQGLSRRWRKKAGKRRLGNPIASSSSDLIRMNPRQYWASTDPQYNGSAKGFPIRCGLKRTALSVIRRFNIIFLPRFIVRNVQLDEQKMEISCHHFGQRNVSIFLIDSSFWMDKKRGRKHLISFVYFGRMNEYSIQMDSIRIFFLWQNWSSERVSRNSQANRKENNGGTR